MCCCPSCGIASGRCWSSLLIIATTCLATSTIGLYVLGPGPTHIHGDGDDLPDAAHLCSWCRSAWSFICAESSSVSEEQLAAITVTSPFSAAMGVPMHTTRNEIWTDKPLAVRRSGAGEHHPQLRLAGLGDLPLHLPAPVPGAAGCDLSGVSLALVAGRRIGIAERSVWNSGTPGGLHARLAAGPRTGSVPFSRYHMLSGPRTRTIASGIVWAAPADRWPRTETLSVQVASMRVLPALFSALKSATSNTSGVNGPACPLRRPAS